MKWRFLALNMDYILQNQTKARRSLGCKKGKHKLSARRSMYSKNEGVPSSFAKSHLGGRHYLSPIGQVPFMVVRDKSLSVNGP